MSKKKCQLVDFLPKKEEEVVILKKKKANKVFIEIETGCHYSDHVNSGKEYTSVNANGKTYGCSFPCDNPNDIESAIQSCKEMIEREGDKWELLKPKVREIKNETKTIKEKIS